MTALGDTVNLASRLQTLAEPGTVYLSETTQRLVQGLVETTFAGAHAIKGKADLQQVYRLDAIRQGATRFDAALGRGLSTYVGRERELAMLERARSEARGELRVIDIVADPGMGKSRLLYEFRQRIGKEQAFVLSGSCSPDGHQTPFLPFIEVVRGSFQVRSGEAENEVARKLEMGLITLGLQSPETLRPTCLIPARPQTAGCAAARWPRPGVDRAALPRPAAKNLLKARCRLSQVLLLLEDLHWADSASQVEVLGRGIPWKARSKAGALGPLHTGRPRNKSRLGATVGQTHRLP